MDEFENHLCEALLSGQMTIFLVSFDPPSECEKIKVYIKKRFKKYKVVETTVGFRSSNLTGIRLKERNSGKIILVEIFRVGAKCYLDKLYSFGTGF